LKAHDPADNPTQENTMKFLSMIRINENAGVKPDAKLMENMGKLMEEATREGWLISTEGLRPTSEGKRVRQRHGALTTTDGPFTETREVIGGYAIIEAKDMAQAVEYTKRFLRVHGPEWDIECELRPLGCGPSEAEERTTKAAGSVIPA
jgi:hypothetical protein